MHKLANSLMMFQSINIFTRFSIFETKLNIITSRLNDFVVNSYYYIIWKTHWKYIINPKLGTVNKECLLLFLLLGFMIKQNTFTCLSRQSIKLYRFISNRLLKLTTGKRPVVDLNGLFVLIMLIGAFVNLAKA